MTTAPPTGTRHILVRRILAEHLARTCPPARIDRSAADLHGALLPHLRPEFCDDYVQLTERMLEVLRLIASGHVNREIGDRLFLSVDTVKTYCRRLYRALGVDDRAHAVARGYQLGILR